jgi:hypothetical protein
LSETHPSEPSTIEGPGDRKEKLNSLMNELKDNHFEWKIVSGQIDNMLHSQEAEQGRTELGREGWEALMQRADACISKMSILENQIVELLDT